MTTAELAPVSQHPVEPPISQPIEPPADRPILDPTKAAAFPAAVLPVLRNPQLRKNVAHAIDVIQAKRTRLAGTAFSGFRDSR
jgi:hypothetical protein